MKKANCNCDFSLDWTDESLEQKLMPYIQKKTGGLHNVGPPKNEEKADSISWWPQQDSCQLLLRNVER